MLRGAVAEIDLDAISRNLRAAKGLSGNRPVIAVVKADAYGHGASGVARRLEAEGVYALAVAYTEEGIALRQAGICSPIIVLCDRDGLSDFFDHGLTPVIHDLTFAQRLSAEAARRVTSINAHVKIDTGMGRLGMNGTRAAGDIAAIADLKNVHVTGLMSHFSDADSQDRSFAGLQLERFIALRKGLGSVLGSDCLCHIANSAALCSFAAAHLDAVRPGIMLYGYAPVAAGAPALSPAMRVTTGVLALRRVSKGSPVSYGQTFVPRRDSLIAVLQVGYADGYSRSFSNRAEVIIRGRRVPVVGRVCMDLTMVDVTGIGDVAEQDEATILGRQGDQEVSATELAGWAGTIPYEILTTLGGRSRRVYTGNHGGDHERD